MLKRLFKLSEDYDGTLTATLDTYSETGARTSSEAVDVSTLPGSLCGDGAILGPVKIHGLPDGIAELATRKTEPAPKEDAAPTLGEEIAADIAEGKAAIRETEEPELLKGRLPPDFPGLEELDAASVHTYGQVRKHIEADTLQKIRGIGKATAAKIVAELEKTE